MTVVPAVVAERQSLCGGPCMKTGIPFTGGSGELLDKSLEKGGIEKHQVFITNVVHCHPPKNHASLPDWVNNCIPYLYEELEIVQPKLMIALGEDAEAALRRRYPAARELRWPFPVAGVTRHAGVVPDILVAKRPSWIARQHDSALADEYVSYLARSLQWAFRDVPDEARPKVPLADRRD